MLQTKFLKTMIHWLNDQYKFSCPTTSLCSVHDSLLIIYYHVLLRMQMISNQFSKITSLVSYI